MYCKDKRRRQGSKSRSRASSHVHSRTNVKKWSRRRGLKARNGRARPTDRGKRRGKTKGNDKDNSKTRTTNIKYYKYKFETNMSHS